MKIKAIDKTLCICAVMIQAAAVLQNIWIHELDRAFIKKKKEKPARKAQVCWITLTLLKPPVI